MTGWTDGPRAPIDLQAKARDFARANHPRGHECADCTSWMVRERPGKPAFIACTEHRIAVEVELAA